MMTSRISPVPPSPAGTSPRASGAFATLGIWCCALLWCLPTGCQNWAPSKARKPVTRVQPHLGTYVSITVYGDPAVVQPAINAAFDEFRAADKLLSIHRHDSALARANASGEVSTALRPVLERALAVAKDTDGAFDPTIRPLADLWGFIKKEGYRMPTGTELEIVLTKVNYRHIELRGNRLIKGAQDASIDSGGFGKGYAVDRAIAVLQQRGIQNAMVKAGGDLRVIGLPPGQEHWTIWIEDPEKNGNRVPVKLKGGAMSTSGQYENFMVINGRRYGHLLDPRTGMPVEGIAACSLTAPTCFESDAYATAAAVLGVDKSNKQFGEKYGMRFVLIDDDGKLRVVQSRLFPER